jgi:hypothetical protein
MVIEGKVEFQPSEVEELFNAIIGIGAKVKLGMGMKSKVSDANHDRWKAEEKEKHLRDYYESRIKELEEDHRAEVAQLKESIQKLINMVEGDKAKKDVKDVKKDIKKNVADK